VIGTIAPVGSRPTFARKASDMSPIQLLPGDNASEYPTSAHSTPTNPSETKLIIMVLRAFLERTSPP
jgi:hypothetical protein